MMLMKRVIVVVLALAIMIVLSVYAAASISSQIGLNFQVNPRIAPMYNLWFHRYMSPTGSSDCKWIGARGLIVFAGSQQSVTCFHQANPKIIAVSYIDRGVYANDPLAQALWGTDSAWLHWQNGSRAFFTYNNQPLYFPNPSSPAVRNYEASNWIPQWKSLGVDGLFVDDGYQPCSVNGVFKICTPNGVPLAEFNNGDYQLWVQAWSDWANWVKPQMGKPFHIYPNGVDWYTTANSTILKAWLSGMDGDFLEYYPRPNTWSDEVSWYYQMQSEYYAANPKAIIDFFPYCASGDIPSLYWLAAYYLIAKNFTTNNLYLSPPFSYPVPQGFSCEGWNTAVWDNLNLGTPLGAAANIDAFGDGTASLYIRLFQHGVVVAMQHRSATDTRTISVNLGGSYVNVTNQSGPLISNITIGTDRAFVGVVKGSQGVAPYNVPTLSPWVLIGEAGVLGVIVKLGKRRSSFE